MNLPRTLQSQTWKSSFCYTLFKSKWFVTIEDTCSHFLHLCRSKNRKKAICFVYLTWSDNFSTIAMNKCRKVWMSLSQVFSKVCQGMINTLSLQVIYVMECKQESNFMVLFRNEGLVQGNWEFHLRILANLPRPSWTKFNNGTEKPLNVITLGTTHFWSL